jgi:acidic leucine-rich nuclear phosphoprotein 32 family protein A/C/D
MEKRLELERRGKEPAQIKELNLDNARATQIGGLSDEYVNLETLSLISVGLTTLKGFPKLASLKKLELSDNRISNGLQALQECPKLSHLNLSNNKLKDLEAIEPLKSFEALTHLDLFNNDICNIEDYRTKVFKLLPNLKFLDDADADDNDEEESDDEGANGAEEGDEDDGEDDDDEVEGEEDEEDSDELSDEEDDDGEMTLSDLYKKNLDDDEDGEDFVEGQ